MENASKALLIAGGVLIALITLSLLVLLSNNIQTMFTAQDQKKAAEQLAEFNAQYEAYNKKLMYGTDVKTVINKAEENNKKYKGNEKYSIVITANDFSFDDDKSKIFKCTGVEYSDEGRIKSMNFEKAE